MGQGILKSRYLYIHTKVPQIYLLLYSPKLKIVKAFNEWQALSVMAETVSNHQEESENVKAFLHQMLQTGQRYFNV